VNIGLESSYEDLKTVVVEVRKMERLRGASGVNGASSAVVATIVKDLRRVAQNERAF
jgi:hypothetical protein